MNKPLLCCLFMVLFALSANADHLPGLGSVLSAGISGGSGIASKVPDLIPSPNTVLAMGKEAFAGMPIRVAIEALNQLCSVAISGNGTQDKFTPDVRKMGLIIKKGTKNATHPLLEPEKIWNDPLFDKNNKLIVYATGWLSDFSDGSTTNSMETVFRAYDKRGGYNFVVLDAAQYLDSVYSWSAFNTELIGELLADALVKLVAQYPIENIHVIGHSLGGQIVGSAGRYFFYKTNQFLPRITGLDPANPCFQEGEALTGIYRGDAVFVDIIHTNNAALGQKQPVGDVDFYPNGAVALQPGCLTIVCAHQRSWEYYAETVYPGNEENFMASRCHSLVAFGAEMCRTHRIPMGFNTPLSAKGNYYLKTRSTYPYGENFKQY